MRTVGRAVAADGDLVVVGAPSSGDRTGAAHAFVRDAGGWRLDGGLETSESAAFDEFGGASRSAARPLPSARASTT